MGRALMYVTLAALALFVLSATFVFQHGGGSTQEVAQVSLRQLRTSPKVFEGDVLTTDGTLDFVAERGLYQVSDNQSLFVVIRKYAGSEDLTGLRGRRVKVTGRFGIDKEHGAYIDADVVLPQE